jgi:multidrug efflux pump subunit AcrA (membrane-fusion protein)
MSLSVKEPTSGTGLPASGQTRAGASPAARRLASTLRLATVLVILGTGGVMGARYLGTEEGHKWRQRALSMSATEAETPDFVPTTQVAKGTLEVSLTIVGTLKAEESVSVVSETSGTITTIVEDGTPVTKGDVLVELQNDQLQLDIDAKKTSLVNAQSQLEDTQRDGDLAAENARNQLAKAQEELAIMKQTNKATLEQAQAALELQQTELALAKAQLGKNLRLAEENLVTQRELDSDRQEVAAKEFSVARAQAQLELQRGQLASNESQKQADVSRMRYASNIATRRIGDEVRNARRNVETIQQQIEDLQDQLTKCTVIAPANGVVVLEQQFDGAMRGMRPGDPVSPRRKLMELPNLEKMVVNCEIEEKDIGPVRKGLPVRISLDPYPGLVYRGVVEEVATVAKPAQVEGSRFQGKNSFSTVIKVLDPDPQRFRPGMNATLEILSATVKDATYIPVDAQFERQEKPLVYVKRGELFYPTPIELGPRNKDYMVVRKGVKPGDTVALVLPEQLLAQ